MQLTPENFKLFISVKKDTFPTKISCLDTTYKIQNTVKEEAQKL